MDLKKKAVRGTTALHDMIKATYRRAPRACSTVADFWMATTKMEHKLQYD